MLYCIDLKTSVVHVLGCQHIPQKNKDKGFLDRFDNPNDAVADAKLKRFSNADSCFHCCPSAHIK